MDQPSNSQMTAFECHVCGNRTSSISEVSEVFELDGRRVLVEHVPAEVCSRCGEAVFSAETAEKIRRLVHGHAKPTSTLSVEVFEFAQA
jgi:YgiT-type zinc finger domain-containing protein